MSTDLTIQDGSGSISLTVSGGGATGSGSVQTATGTVTASGGSSPAVDSVLANVSTNQTLAYFPLLVYVDSDPSFNADYAFNYDYSHQWDDSAGELDIDLTVNWDTDPGAGNDVTLRWEVRSY